MLLSTQIYIGTSMISDGTLMLTDAATNGGFMRADAYSNIEADRAITKLRKLLADLEDAQKALRTNDTPVPFLMAAE